MSSTNGRKATPSRDQIIREATYHAAVTGWYDTSKSAQKSDLLTITMMDMGYVPGEALPEGATHQFYVCINATAFMVTRYSDGRYETVHLDQIERQREERELREAVVDMALWHLTGEGAGYRPDPRPDVRATERAAAIQELLEGVEPDEERDGGPIVHPVIRDEEPDLDISLAAGEGGTAEPLRQWDVRIGESACKVVLFGYDIEDESPVLVAVDAEEPEYDYEDDDEDEE